MIVTPAWQSQSWYRNLLEMTIKNSIVSWNHPNVLLSQDKEIRPLIQNASLKLVA